MALKKFLLKQKKQLMKEFDFKKIHEVMTFLNWTWYFEDVPSIEDLKNRVEELSNECIARYVNRKYKYGSDRMYVATGGFIVDIWRDQLWISFKLEDAIYDYEEKFEKFYKKHPECNF